MAKVNVFRFDEEELVANDSLDSENISLVFHKPRLIARVDSVDAAVKLLGISGMRPINEEKHPIVVNRLRYACEYYSLPRPAEILRGVHGTFVIMREDAPRKPRAKVTAPVEATA